MSYNNSCFQWNISCSLDLITKCENWTEPICVSVMGRNYYFMTDVEKARTVHIVISVFGILNLLFLGFASIMKGICSTKEPETNGK